MSSRQETSIAGRIVKRAKTVNDGTVGAPYAWEGPFTVYYTAWGACRLPTKWRGQALDLS